MADWMSLRPVKAPLTESAKKTCDGSAPLTGSVVPSRQADSALQVWSNGPPNAPPAPLPLVPLFVHSVAPPPVLVIFRSQAMPVQPATSACASTS